MSDKTTQDLVQEFHELVRHPINAGFKHTISLDGQLTLRDFLPALQVINANIREKCQQGGLHLQRFSLILEEVVELGEALARGDEIEAADGLGDIQYLLDGTAVAFGWNLDSIVREIHRSNMTKTIGEGFKASKGKNYDPPNIKKFLG